MSERPEATGGGYRHLDPDGYDPAGWQEFTPWRPGDPSPSDEVAPGYAAEFGADGRGAFLDEQPSGQPPAGSVWGKPGRSARTGRPSRVTTQHTVQHSGESERFKAGDKVRNRATVAGQLGMDHVPTNTRGRVVSTRLGFLGGSYATVAFENGYVEEIQTDAIERRSWWD